MSEPTYREMHFRCMVMPKGYEDAELTQLMADLLYSYKDVSLERRRAVLQWAMATLDYAP